MRRLLSGKETIPTLNGKVHFCWYVSIQGITPRPGPIKVLQEEYPVGEYKHISWIFYLTAADVFIFMING